MAHAKACGFWLCLIALCLTGWSPANGAAPGKNNVPASVERDAQHLIETLTARGFQVARGYPKLYTEEDCSYSYEVMKTCYANNPAGPYVMFVTPSWPDEIMDPATKNAFDLVPDGYSVTFRFDPREAVVILGQLPPPAAYFGLQTYLFTREGTFDTASPTYQYIAGHYPSMPSGLD